ncbi:putative processing peptidase [Helianthus anomalus]
MGIKVTLKAEFRITPPDISCIKDMTMLYEAATIEDVYLPYEQLKIDDQSLYCCIDITGAKADDEVSGES